jgi:DNA (cytosine-5)-methyltransferase 1
MKKYPKPIPVIDLFAGPGGLGEGFSSVFHDEAEKHPVFELVLSVEKDPHAHQTLELRAFYRHVRLHSERGLTEYYTYVRGGAITRQELFERNEAAATYATEEANLLELGNADHDKIIREKIKACCKEYKGRPKVLIGGPPCQAYSLAGRSKNMNTASYDANSDHRHTLYRKYLEIIKQWKPDIFVMENVKGILSSKLNGERIFPTILSDLSAAASGYKIRSFVEQDTPDLFEDLNYLIKSEEYGIPQKRHRVILLGIKKGSRYTQPEPYPTLTKKRKPVSIDSVISDLPVRLSKISRREKTDETTPHFLGTLTKKQLGGLTNPHRRSVAAKSRPMTCPDKLRDWLIDPRMKGDVMNHETRSHIKSDIARYLYFAIRGAETGRSPNVQDFPKNLLPDHKNVASGHFLDRFRVQVAGQPATTIVSHISKDGHYYIHYDPLQARSLTVREAARIQTFPDNYFFEGPRTQQYHQVGNAVPPFIAAQIAKIVGDSLR